MSRAVMRLRAWLTTLSPEMRGLIHGAGMALDAYPVRSRRGFLTNDAVALHADWRALGNSMRTAMKHPTRNEGQRTAAH